MLAYKFTRPGAVSPFSRFSWPMPAGGRPGEWVQASESLPCRAGIHACRPAQLPYWLAAELWAIELDGEVVETADKVVARRGRLVEAVGAWTGGGAAAFAADCAFRARDLATEALGDAGAGEEAGALAACADLAALLAGTRSLAGRFSGLADLLVAYAGDSAFFAQDGQVPLAAYVTTVAAADAAAGGRHQDATSPAARDERARQGAWLAAML